jgi:tetratricopeptide (TPR) repeat protein
MNSKIKFTLTLLFIFIFAREAYTQEANTSKFNQGVSFYTSGNYQDALKVWTDIYNIGYRSLSLDYNIGNAYFKLNNIPFAILFYERAYLINPADENVNYNLQIARTMIVDRFNEIPEVFFVRWYNFMSLILSSNGWAKISILSFILSLLALSLYMYSSKYLQKVIGFWVAISFFILTLTSFALTIRNKELVYDSHKAIITNPQISGKSSPDSSGTDLFVLHEGTKVSVEDEVGDWFEIKLSDGNKGWVPGNSLNVI